MASYISIEVDYTGLIEWNETKHGILKLEYFDPLYLIPRENYIAGKVGGDVHWR